MKIQSLGHVVIKVRNQQRAEAFYNGLLGLPIADGHRLRRPPATSLRWAATNGPIRVMENPLSSP